MMLTKLCGKPVLETNQIEAYRDIKPPMNNYKDDEDEPQQAKIVNLNGTKGSLSPKQLPPRQAVNKVDDSCLH